MRDSKLSGNLGGASILLYGWLEICPTKTMGNCLSSIFMIRMNMFLIHFSSSPGHFLALKVLTIDASNEAQNSSTNELAMLLRTSIGQQPDHRSPTPLYSDEDNGLEGPPHLGWTRVAGFLGCFGFEHSKHLVIMSPLYGEHMKNYMRGEPNGRLSISLVKQIARETTLALDYLHNQCGIIHCGTLL